MDHNDETFIVIMQKDGETGFLDKELGCYKTDDESGMIFNTYAVEEDGQLFVYLKLTCDRDVEDWEYDAIFDYYDSETLLNDAISVDEEDGDFNPVWIVKFAFVDDVELMENKLTQLLDLHKKELKSVYETIADKKDEYSNAD